MTVSTSTILSQTLTNQSGDWSSGPLAAGTFNELLMNAILTAVSAPATITISYIDTFNNLVQIWGAQHNEPGQDTVDIGPCDGYACSHAWGASIQVDILTSGTVSGTISLQGKG